jgi:hypothetical protein
MSDEKPILQYRAMGSRRRYFQVVGVYRIPLEVKRRDRISTGRLKRYEFKTFQWGLTRTRALAAANALNALNNLPLQETAK